MSSINRGQYTVTFGASWKLYTVKALPGWEMLGTIQRDHEIGALGKSPAGLYAQINAGVIRSLDQRKVKAAIYSPSIP